MSTIVLRSVKGSPLSNAEVDSNFTNLNTDKTELGGTYSSGTANGVLFLSSSKVLTTGSALTFDGTSLGVAASGVTQTLIRPYTGGNYGSIYSGAVTPNGNNFVLSYNATEAYLNGNSFTAFTISGSEQMRLTSTGLGIGTSSPASRLDVNGKITLRNDSDPRLGYIQNTGGALFIGSETGGTTEIVFQTNGPTERMRLDSSGNLGIGTSSPISRLQVVDGDITVTTSGSFSFLNTTRAFIPSGPGQLLGGLRFRGYSTGTTYVDGAQILASSDGAAWSSTSAPTYLSFQTTASGATSPTERMQLSASGNLGLGVTPSGWSSSFKAMQLSTQTALWSSGTGTFLSTNAYNDNANKYIGTGHAARYYQLTGAHIWETAPSGTAGDAISFTQAMTLDASGRLGVGTTSPNYALTVGAVGSTADSYIQIGSTTSGTGNLFFGDTAGAGSGSFAGFVQYQHNVDAMVFGTNDTERARIDSSGNLIQTVNTTAATLATNGTLTFSIVDNSTLRISVRGSDGTTRTATVALT
jgi:hypothetical protein